MQKRFSLENLHYRQKVLYFIHIFISIIFITMSNLAISDTNVWALSTDGYSVITKDMLEKELLTMASEYTSVGEIVKHIKFQLWEWWWGTESWSTSILASLDALIKENECANIGSESANITTVYDDKLVFNPNVLRTIYADLSNYQHDIYTNLSESSNHIPLSALYRLITSRESHRWDIWQHTIWVMQDITSTILTDIASSDIDISIVTDKYIPQLLRMYYESNPVTAATVIQTLNRAYEDMRMSHEVDQSVLAKIDAMRDAFLWAIPQDKMLLRFAQSAIHELSTTSDINKKGKIMNIILYVHDLIKERQPNFIALFLPYLKGEMRHRIVMHRSAGDCYKSLQSRSLDNPLITEMARSYDCLEAKYMTDFLYGWQSDKQKTPWLIQTIHRDLQAAIKSEKINVQWRSREECLQYVKFFLFRHKKYSQVTEEDTYIYWLCTKPLEEAYAYIDRLLDTSGISEEAIYQLQEISKNIPTMLANGYDMKRISVIDGRVAVDWQRFVAEDGWERRQAYKSMQEDPKNKTYPQYAESLFEMAGAMIGKKFQKPKNRWKIQDGTVDGNAMVEALNTSDNKAILVKLREIIGFNGYIPLWLDSNDEVIYAYVRSGDGWFHRSDHPPIINNNFLIPSKSS